MPSSTLGIPPWTRVIRLFQGFGIALHAPQCGLCRLLGSWCSRCFQVWNSVLVQEDLSTTSPGRWSEPCSTLRSILEELVAVPCSLFSLQDPHRFLPELLPGSICLCPRAGKVSIVPL